MSTYQGHLPDGSSVQRHSAGGIYPIIPFARDSEHGLAWGLIMPGGRELMVGAYEAAIELAVKIKASTEVGRQLRALRSLETLSGDPREEPAPTGTDWFAMRDFDCWYDGLVRDGVTTQQEIFALQRAVCDDARGLFVAPEQLARYRELRAAAACGQVLTRVSRHDSSPEAREAFRHERTHSAAADAVRERLHIA